RSIGSTIGTTHVSLMKFAQASASSRVQPAARRVACVLDDARARVARRAAVEARARRRRAGHRQRADRVAAALPVRALGQAAREGELRRADGVSSRVGAPRPRGRRDRKSTRLNSSHVKIAYAGFCWTRKETSYTNGELITVA